MQKRDIEKLTDDTINSFDGANRAETKPFLLTRIYARMRSREAAQNIWMKAGSFLSTPRVALAGLALIIILNAAILIRHSNSDENVVQNSNVVKDEFAMNVVSIYDIENQEP